MELISRSDPFPTVQSQTVLPRGNGRSYGDSCLNVGGALLQVRSLDRLIRFDTGAGVLACEAGMLLGDILRLTVPAGWFLPVVPGTQYVTVGGAIANDVHGKNHHRAGTFGGHVRSLELLRSTGERLSCGPQVKREWFSATIGGLGLTGIITWVELQLRAIKGPYMEVESTRFTHLGEFFELREEADRRFEYTVAWIDCAVGGKQLGRGLLQGANHSAMNRGETNAPRLKLSVPFSPRVSLVRPLSVRAFNSIHYHRQLTRRVRTIEHFQKFLFPLDHIQHWNRLYGSRGFYQYQCVIPEVAAASSIREMLQVIARGRLGSFLTVLKEFGSNVSPGLLSFPLPGVTLALDFSNRQPDVERLFNELDAIVAAAGGRLYPGKDARMSAAFFQSSYPRWQEFSRFIDPRFSSNLLRRVTG